MKMTDKSIRALKPEAKRTRHRDDAVKGLGMIIEPGGSMTWNWVGRINGVIRNYVLGHFPAYDYQAARKWALEIIDHKDRGIDIILERENELKAKEVADGKTGQWLFETWIEKDSRKIKENKEGTIREKINNWNRDFKPLIGEMSIFDIDHDTLEDIIVQKAETAPIQANHLVSLICRMFRWATRQGRRTTGLTSNPAADLYKPSAAKSRDHFLTDREIGYLLASLETVESVAVPAAKLLIWYGLRRSEAFGARWSEFDFEKREWTIPKERTKNSLPFVITLSDEAIELVKSQPRHINSDMVFWSKKSPQNPISGITRFHTMLVNATMELAKADGVEMKRWLLHDLRRTMSTSMNSFRDKKDRSLVGSQVVEACLNHISGTAKAGVAGVYNRHQYYAEKKAAWNLWHSHLNTCLKAEKARARGRKSEALKKAA